MNRRSALFIVFLLLIIISMMNTFIASGIFTPTRSFPGRIVTLSGYKCEEGCILLKQIGYEGFSYSIVSSMLKYSKTLHIDLSVFDLVGHRLLYTIPIYESRNISMDEAKSIMNGVKNTFQYYSIPSIDVLVLTIKNIKKTLLIFKASNKPEVKKMDTVVTKVIESGDRAILKTSGGHTYIITRRNMVNADFLDKYTIYTGSNIYNHILLFAFKNQYVLLDIVNITIVKEYIIEGIQDRSNIVNFKRAKDKVFIRIGNKLISYGVLLNRSSLSLYKIAEADLPASSYSIYILGDKIALPILINNSLQIILYDQVLRPMGSTLIFKYKRQPRIRIWEGYKNKYLIIWVKSSDKSIVLTYSYTGSIRVVDESSSKSIVDMRPIYNGLSIMAVNTTTDKTTGRKEYNLHIKTIDGAYDKLVVSDFSYEHGIVVVNGPVSTTITYTVKTAISPKSYLLFYRIARVYGMALLIPRGIPVLVYVESGGSKYAYQVNRDGEPVTIPSGNLYVRFVSLVGYTGSEENYKPIPLNVKDLDVVEVNTTTYSAEIVVNGGYAEITFQPDNGVSFAITHSGGIARYYIPPGHYHLVIRFGSGVVGEGDITLTPGSTVTIHLEDYLPSPSILDYLIDNIVPLIVILITIVSIILVAVAVLTLRREAE